MCLKKNAYPSPNFVHILKHEIDVSFGLILTICLKFWLNVMKPMSEIRQKNHHVVKIANET